MAIAPSGAGAPSTANGSASAQPAWCSICCGVSGRALPRRPRRAARRRSRSADVLRQASGLARSAIGRQSGVRVERFDRAAQHDVDERVDVELGRERVAHAADRRLQAAALAHRDSRGGAARARCACVGRWPSAAAARPAAGRAGSRKGCAARPPRRGSRSAPGRRRRPRRARRRAAGAWARRRATRARAASPSRRRRRNRRTNAAASSGQLGQTGLRRRPPAAARRPARPRARRRESRRAGARTSRARGPSPTSRASSSPAATRSGTAPAARARASGSARAASAGRCRRRPGTRPWRGSRRGRRGRAATTGSNPLVAPGISSSTPAAARNSSANTISVTSSRRGSRRVLAVPGVLEQAVGRRLAAHVVGRCSRSGYRSRRAKRRCRWPAQRPGHRSSCQFLLYGST